VVRGAGGAAGAVAGKKDVMSSSSCSGRATVRAAVGSSTTPSTTEARCLRLPTLLKAEVEVVVVEEVDEVGAEKRDTGRGLASPLPPNTAMWGERRTTSPSSVRRARGVQEGLRTSGAGVAVVEEVEVGVGVTALTSLSLSIFPATVNFSVSLSPTFFCHWVCAPCSLESLSPRLTGRADPAPLPGRSCTSPSLAASLLGVTRRRHSSSPCFCRLASRSMMPPPASFSGIRSGILGASRSWLRPRRTSASQKSSDWRQAGLAERCLRERRSPCSRWKAPGPSPELPENEGEGERAGEEESPGEGEGREEGGGGEGALRFCCW